MAPFQTDITSLGQTASFYDWFTQYNTDVLGKLNNVKLARPYAGDGITFSFANDGGYTFELSGTVAKNVIFSGDVTIQGNASFSTSQLSGLVLGFSGNYLAAGVTTGKVVRLTSDGGLTLAKADSASNAEVLGIALSAGTTLATVAVAGKVSGTTLANNLVSGGFTSGCVFFLDATVAGGITRAEPTTIGYVSKPVILGIDASQGLILPYRGQYINGICGGSGDNFFNSAIYIDIKSKGETLSDFKLRPGAVLGTEEALTDSPNQYESYAGNNVYFKSRNTTQVEKILGIVSEFVGSYSGTTGDKVTLKVNTNGSVISNITSLTNWSAINGGIVYLNSVGNPTLIKGSSDVLVVGNVSNGTLVVNIDSPNQIINVDSGGGGAGQFKNYLINGSLSLWQRGRGVCGAYGVTAGSTPVKRYLADRWIMWGASGENGFTGQRQTFSPITQKDVGGYPKYYVSLIKNTTVATDKSYFYNVIEDPRTVSEKQVTFSFYARTPGGTGSFTINSVQYNTSGGYVHGTTHATKTTSNSNWARYDATFIGPTASASLPSYFLVGVGLGENGKTFEFAQFILEEGGTASTPQFVNIDEEYEKAAPFYQRSYLPDEITGTNTITDNRGVLRNLLPRNLVLSETFKYPMIRVPDSVNIFSLKGNLGEISFKDTSSNDSITWYDSKDSALFISPLINCQPSITGSLATRWNGFAGNPPTNPISNRYRTKTDFFFVPYTSHCWFDFVGFHYVADADTVIQ